MQWPGLAELGQGFGACQTFKFKSHSTKGAKLMTLRASPQGEETAPRGQFTWQNCQHSDSAFRGRLSRNGHARPPGVPKGRFKHTTASVGALLASRPSGSGTPIKGLAGTQRVSSVVLNLASRGRLERPQSGLAPRGCMPRWKG